MVVIRVFICASIIIVTSSAPIAEDGKSESGFADVNSHQFDYLRGKTLNPNIYPMSPCAAAASSEPIAVAPGTAYHNNIIPTQARDVPNAYDYGYSGYQGSMYRAEDPYRDEREMLSFSDTNFMDQMPASRIAYTTAPANYVPVNTGNIAGVSGQYIAPVGPVYGVFPKANIGGCNVPLLFSCSPSVVTGQMIKPGTHVYGSPPSSILPHPNAYSGGEHYLQQIHTSQKQAIHNNISPINNAA